MQLVFTTTSEVALHKRYIKYHGMELTENHVKTFLKDLTKDRQYASRSLDWISDDTQISIQRTNNK
jgi:cell division septal protein FtsQ